MARSFDVSRASTTALDPARAVVELVEALGSEATAYLVFVSPRYDLDVLGPALRAAFSGIVIGCTSPSPIGPDGIQSGGIAAVALRGGDHLSARSFVIDGLDDLSTSVERVTRELTAHTATMAHRPSFGVLLVDGLSEVEERLISGLYSGVGDVPIVGGSAADDLEFRATHVLANGTFRTGRAVLTVFSTDLPFHVFRLQHHVPSARRLVVTGAEPERRVVRTINGRSAAMAYAELVGVPVHALGPGVFSAHPLMLRVADQYYVRSIQRADSEGCLHFYCAIDAGLVLTLARSDLALDRLERELAAITSHVGVPALVLGFDGILRNLEYGALGVRDSVGALFKRHGVIGFGTFGEQIDAMHVNQTLVGVAIGAEQ